MNLEDKTREMISPLGPLKILHITQMHPHTSKPRAEEEEMIHSLRITKAKRASVRALVTPKLEKILGKDLLSQSEPRETFHLERDL